jgi:uncharacterized protein YndB with AHSA1/START domain/predicted enzyme related to lactoylglutathione lyase
MKLRGLRTAQFRPSDLGGARDWYTGLFEIAPYFDEPFYVGFEIAGYEFGLFSDESDRTEPLFLWATEDPAGYIARAVSLGAQVGMEPRDTGDGIVVGSFIDPFGNEFGLIRNPHFAAQLVEASADDISDRVITLRSQVPCTPGEAFTLWATSEGLAQWWTENSEVDLRPGGKYEIHFRPDAAPGDRGGDWCRVLSFLPGKMLSFTWNSPPELKTRALHTWVVVLFNETDSGTDLEFNHYGWPASGMADADSDWPATYEYFEGAWGYVVTLFEGHFQTP